MTQTMEPERAWTLSDYALDSRLREAVGALQVEASIVVPTLRDRTTWMVHSTAQGGGVAEMLPRMVALMEELGLPMDSRKENAVMVNALQRCSTVIVQNSLRKGFGLTATETMWKGVCTVSSRACGLRQQIRSGIDGIQIQDSEDSDEIARRLEDILYDVREHDYTARNGQQRVHDEFLVFKQLCGWLRLLSACATAPSRSVDQDRLLEGVRG